MADQRHIASFSGGKDSTAMVLRLIEEGWPLDEIVFFDTGWEFPAMADHIAKVQEYIGREITRLHPRLPFVEWMLRRRIKARTYGLRKLTVPQLREKWRTVRREFEPDMGVIPRTRDALLAGINGRVHRIGNGWPSPMRRWCTREKIDSIDRHCCDAVRYIGFAADEATRTEGVKLCEKKYDRRYPLIEWGMDEEECLAYCYDRGFQWGGLYTHFRRVSCFCCPLQRIGELRKLRKHFPDLWAQMLDWDSRMGAHNRGFRGYKKVYDMEKRFALEDSVQKKNSAAQA